MDNMPTHKYSIKKSKRISRDIEKADNTQKIVIRRLVEKLFRSGPNVIKKLHPSDDGWVGEMKVKRPPYRLLIYVNESEKTIYLLRWIHKKEQQRAIDEITKSIIDFI